VSDYIYIPNAGEDDVALLKQIVCEATSLTKEEVEVEIDCRGILHVITKPKVNAERASREPLRHGTSEPRSERLTQGL